ncbi:MAG TPA: membrane dipeptidase [Steroidobacteraceae bacterium]|jgi:membrane dipeptidase|nr:membrane dipeptidase [Steroidobacteraceae bacterium]
MNRREFSVSLAGTAAAAALTPLPAAEPAAAPAPGVSPHARALYHSALILDCNSSPPEGRLPLPQADLDAVHGSGVDVVKYSIGGINDDFPTTIAEIGQVQQLIETYPAYFTQVRVSGDLARAKAEGKLGIILSFESVEMLQGRLESLEVFRNLGVRVMQLSYNRKSPFAAGVMEPDGGGLTALGRQAVTEMNRLGIAIDLSHANAATTSDVLELSGKAPLMTHAGCMAIHPHPRNKTDEQLRALADRGGVVGIFDLPYLTASPRQPTVDDYLMHLEHALKVVGEDHVGIGSDTDILPMDVSEKGMAELNKQLEQRRTAGLAAPEEDRPPYVIGLNTPRRIEVIVDALLKRGYPPGVVEKVAGANFGRAFADIWNV